MTSIGDSLRLQEIQINCISQISKYQYFFSQFFPGSTSKGPSSQGTQRKTLVQFLHKIKNGGVFYLSNTFLVNQDLISLEISTQKMIFSENFHKNLTPNI